MNSDYKKKVSRSISLIENEISSVKEKYPNNFNSLHEGYAVMLEEVNELWDEVKKKNPDPERIYDECKQVAAMAVRIMCELGESKAFYVPVNGIECKRSVLNCRGFVLIKKLPHSDLKLGYFEPFTTGEFFNYPEFWYPIYEGEKLLKRGDVNLIIKDGMVKIFGI